MVMLRNGTVPRDRRLDRIPSADPRNAEFPVRLMAQRALFGAPRSYTWQVGSWLDQGQDGACVGFSFSHDLIARPSVIIGVTNDYAKQLYFAAQRADDWPGGEYAGASPVYGGTSVLAGAKVLTERGFYSSYHWTTSATEVGLVVGYHGPVVLGINWREAMFDPDADGQLHVDGPVAGGHAILAHAVDAKRGRVWLWNSWGSQWGVDGRAWVSMDSLARLLADDGEACVPVRTTRRTV